MVLPSLPPIQPEADPIFKHILQWAILAALHPLHLARKGVLGLTELGQRQQQQKVTKRMVRTVAASLGYDDSIGYLDSSGL